MISSSFFGVLFQIFWKDAEFADFCFSVMSPRKKLWIRRCKFESQLFSASTFFLRSFKTILYSSPKLPSSKYYGLFLTPNCQSEPEWNPKIKLETQGLLAGSLHKLWLLNDRKKTGMTVRRVWVLRNFRMYSKVFYTMNCRFIELHVFSKSIMKITFSLD